MLKMTPCYVFNNIMLCLVHCANRIMDTHQWVRPGIGETERTPPSSNGSQRAASLRKIFISCGRKNIILYKINTVVSTSNTSRPMYKPTKFCVYKISCIHGVSRVFGFLPPWRQDSQAYPPLTSQEAAAVNVKQESADISCTGSGARLPPVRYRYVLDDTVPNKYDDLYQQLSFS